MQMRHTAHELRVTLDHVLQGGEASVAPQNPESETVSFLNESEAEMRAIHDMAEVRTRARSRAGRVLTSLMFSESCLFTIGLISKKLLVQNFHRVVVSC